MPETLIVILLNGGGNYAANANPVAAHGNGYIFAIFVQHPGIHFLAVLLAQLEDVAHFYAIYLKNIK